MANLSDRVEAIFEPIRGNESLPQFEVGADADQRQIMSKVEPDHLDENVARFFLGIFQNDSGRQRLVEPQPLADLCKTTNIESPPLSQLGHG